MGSNPSIPAENRDRILHLTAAAFFGGTEALRQCLLTLRPDFRDPNVFQNCLNNARQNGRLQRLFPDQTALLFPASGTVDMNSLDITLLGKVIFACTSAQGNRNIVFDINNFPPVQNPPTCDGDYVHLMEKFRNEFAHWGDKEISKDDYKKYWLALEYILKHLNFDVSKVEPFKSYPCSGEGAFWKGRMLAHFGILLDNVHDLQDHQLVLESQVNNLATIQSSNLSTQQQQIVSMQQQIDDVRRKSSEITNDLVTYATEVAKATEFTKAASDQFRMELQSKQKSIGELQTTLIEVKREVSDLQMRMGKVEENLVSHEVRIGGLEACVDQHATCMGEVQSDIREVQSDIREVQSDIREVQSGIEAVKEAVIKLKVENAASSCALSKFSPEELAMLKLEMQKNGLEWVERQVVTDPVGRRQRNVELEVRVDPVLVENPEEDVSRVEGKSEHEILNMLQSKCRRGVEYKDIIDTGTQVTFVRAVGGGGKSVLSITLYHLWCKGEILQDFDFVILLQARGLNALDVSSDFQVHHLLQSNRALHKCNVRLEDLLLCEKRILFILDGLDELVAQDELLAKVLRSRFQNPTALGKGLGFLIDAVCENKHCFVLFLGRHAACMKLEKAWQTRQMRTRLVELAGYSREKIMAYVSKFADGNRDVESRLVMFLRSSPSLMNLVSIPLYLWVFCSVYSESKSKIGPQTETELLIYMLLCFFKWHARVTNEGDDLSQLEFFELLERSELMQLVSKLTKLAYDHLSKNELIFSVDSEVLRYVSDESGLLITAKTSHGLRVQFMHKTLHELLAAAYMATADIQASDVLSNGYLKPCIPILCAFKGAQRENSSSPQFVQDFVQKMLRLPQKSGNLDDLPKQLFSDLLPGTSELSFKNLEWNEFLRCFREFSNIIELEPCIPWLPCNDLMSSRYLQLVCYFLQSVSPAGIVRNLYIDLRHCKNDEEVKEWSFVLEKLWHDRSRMSVDRQLVGLLVYFSPHFSLTPAAREAIKGLVPNLETCCFVDIDRISLDDVVEGLKNCSKESSSMSRMKKLVLLSAFPSAGLQDLDVRALLPLIDRLESLALGNAVLSTSLLRDFVDTVCKRPTGQLRLSLVGCSLVKRHLFQLVRCFGKLTELDISNMLESWHWNFVRPDYRNHFTYEAIRQVPLALKKNAIKDFELEIRSCSLKDKHLTILIPALSHCRRLDLSFNTAFSARALKSFSEAASKQVVRGLDLSFNNCGWKDESLSALLPMKPCLATLGLIDGWFGASLFTQFKEIVKMRPRFDIPPSLSDFFPSYYGSENREELYFVNNATGFVLPAARLDRGVTLLGHAVSMIYERS